MLYRQDYSLTQASLFATLADATEARMVQTGDGCQNFGFEAESYVRMGDNSAIWGDASYTNGERNNVVWNETSDIELLYPYLIADSIGGDLRFEQYYLNGGYAARQGKFSYGAGLRYRARSEYRSVDPRPNNVVADLMASIGVGMNLGERYLISISGSAGKYKQTSNVKYFNELGSAKEYHLTGIGNDYFRFSGANNNLFFKGKNFGASADLMPLHQKGFSATVAFNRFSFDKILTDLNRLPLNRLVENSYNAEFTWIAGNGIHQYGIVASGSYKERNGNDNLFGDGAGNLFPQIGTEETYENKITEISISGCYERRLSDKWTLGAKPHAGYYDYASSHRSSGNEFNFSNINLGISAKASYATGRSLWSLSATSGFRINCSANLSVSDAFSRSKSLKAAMQHAYDYMSANENAATIALRYDFSLAKAIKTLFIEARWQHAAFMKGQNENLFELKTGITL